MPKPALYLKIHHAIATADNLPSFKLSDHRAKWDSIKTLEEAFVRLTEMDEILLNSKSFLIEHQGKKTRLYPTDKAFSVQETDIYARGLQHVSAAIKIALWEELELSPEKIAAYLKHYHAIFEQIGSPHTHESFAKANDATLALTSMLAYEISAARIKKSPPNIEQKDQEVFFEQQYQLAFKDIKKATEVLAMIAPQEDSLCTVTKTANGYSLQISERLSFANDLTFEQAKKTPWYKQNVKSHGPWFQIGLYENFDAFMTASSPCTTRDLPNPANAWQETLCEMDEDGNIVQEYSATRVAITSPFQIKDHDAREDMAYDNVKKILGPYTLNQVAKSYIQQWAPLLEGVDEIHIPILHQTLVAPTFFYGPDRDMIEVKTSSNQRFRQEMLSEPLIVAGKTVRFELEETNNCINLWHPIVNPRNKDVEDSNKLVNHATFLTQRLQAKLGGQNADCQNTINFLKNNKRSWLPFKPFSNKEPSQTQIASIEKLCQDLSQGKIKGSMLPLEQQQDLSLMIQAAVNLKKLNHETHFGWALRKFNNLIRIKGVAPLSFITGTIASPFYLARYALNTASRIASHLRDGAPPKWNAVFLPTLNGYKNKQTFKSAYEEILAGKLGMIFGGCKSAYDRAGEARNHKTALLRHFNRDGKLLDFDMSDKEYYEYVTKEVGQLENEGHQNRVPATIDRIGARKMWESSTYHYTQTLSSEERKIIRGHCAKFRKLKAPLKGRKKEEAVSSYEKAWAESVPALPTSANLPTSSLPPEVASLSPRVGYLFEREHTFANERELQTTLVDKQDELQALEHYLNTHRKDYAIEDITTLSLKEQPCLAVQMRMSEKQTPTFYAGEDKEGIRYSTLKKMPEEEYLYTLNQICRITVDRAPEKAEFDLSDTPKEKQAAVHHALTQAIEQAIKAKRFNAENKPIIVGYQLPEPAKPGMGN